MNYNVGDTLFTDGAHKGRTVKEIEIIDPEYIKCFTREYPERPESKAYLMLLTARAWLNKPVLIPDNLIVDAMIFSHELAPTMEHIKDRNQPNKDKWVKDITDGRIGEWIAHYILSDIYSCITIPDQKIYAKKTWKPNLVDVETGQEFSVHTQNTKSKRDNGESWTFAVTDPLVKNEADPKTKICFILIDRSEQIGQLRAIVNIDTLHKKNLFKPPAAVHLIPHKKCIYFKDLEDLDRCEL